MKKNYFAFAALAAAMVLASCNKDEGNDNPKFDGIGAVSIKIQNPGILTRATVDPTSGSGNVEIDGTLTVTLTHNGGETMSISIDPNQINNTPLIFWNVTNPTKITASINGGVADYSNVAIIDGTPELQVLPANIPAYGEVDAAGIRLTDQSASPDLNNSTTQTGAGAGDDDKTYQMYEASIQMSIPVARLEVSGITHVTHPDEEDDECKYSALTINGVYMDGLKATGGATGLTDYCWDGTSNTGTGATAILKDVINGVTGDSFLTQGGTWPEEGKTFAYNFYTGAGNPTFKIYFGHAEAAEGADPVLSPRYAMIEQYTDQNGDPVTMQAGRIYRITKAELKDKHILGDEGGETVYGVTVTVTEATWTVVDIDADWKE